MIDDGSTQDDRDRNLTAISPRRLAQRQANSEDFTSKNFFTAFVKLWLKYE